MSPDFSAIKDQNISIRGLTKHAFTMRALTTEEVLSIYTSHSVRHFPADELKPAASIKRMLEEGIYTGCGIFASPSEADVSPVSGGSLLCYALFTILSERKNILLDYFAVMEEYRNLGIGSLFLKQFTAAATSYDGILIEVENPDFAAGAEDLAVRTKRIGFYERNGAVQTDIRAEIFGARYRLLFLPLNCTPSAEVLYSDFDRMYRHMVSPESYRTQVKIFFA